MKKVNILSWNRSKLTYKKDMSLIFSYFCSWCEFFDQPTRYGLQFVTRSSQCRPSGRRRSQSTSKSRLVENWIWYFVTKIVQAVRKKLFQWSRKSCEIWGWRSIICKNLEITWTIYLNSERSEQFLATESFFNLFLRGFSDLIN